MNERASGEDCASDAGRERPCPAEHLLRCQQLKRSTRSKATSMSDYVQLRAAQRMISATLGASPDELESMSPEETYALRDRVKQIAPKQESPDDEDCSASVHSGPSLCDSSDTEPEFEDCTSRVSDEDVEKRVEDMDFAELIAYIRSRHSHAPGMSGPTPKPDRVDRDARSPGPEFEPMEVPAKWSGASGVLSATASHLGCILNSGATAVINSVAAARLEAGWRRMKVTVDSGAAESVIPELEETRYPKSKHAQDIFYSTASGEPILNLGEQRIPMWTANGRPCAMTFQACDVMKPLASVKRMVEAGNAVVFAPDEWGGSFVVNCDTLEEEQLREEDGNYVLDVWVPPPDSAPGFTRPA